MRWRARPLVLPKFETFFWVERGDFMALWEFENDWWLLLLDTCEGRAYPLSVSEQSGSSKRNLTPHSHNFCLSWVGLGKSWNFISRTFALAGGEVRQVDVVLSKRRCLCCWWRKAITWGRAFYLFFACVVRMCASKFMRRTRVGKGRTCLTQAISIMSHYVTQKRVKVYDY